MVFCPRIWHHSSMGMLNRRTVLIGLVGVGGIALLADRSLLSKANAMTSDLAGAVEQAKKATAIADTLQSGDPVQIQDLLNRLVDEEGTSTDAAQPSLFGMLTSFSESPEPVEGTGSRSDVSPNPSPAGDRVSMIITTRNGGLAVVNGRAMQQGETVGGVTLLAVHPDRVVLDGRGGTRVITLPGPADLPMGPSVAAAPTPTH